MGAFIKLDEMMLRNRLGWRTELPPPEGVAATKPQTTNDYKGVFAGARVPDDAPEGWGELVVNQKLSVFLDCSVEPVASYYQALVAVNPALLALAEVSAPTLLLAGYGRVQPVLHIRALKKFDIREFSFLASIHLID